MPFSLVAVVLVFLGLLPSFAWLVFYIREDTKHPEPKSLLIYAFFLGAFITLAVLPIQRFIDQQLVLAGIARYSLIAFMIFGVIEEFFKFLVVYLFIHKRKEFDEPLHAMIYMITAALGFAAAENIASLFQTAHGSIFNIAILEALTLRFVGATLLHSLASGLIGYQWGLAFIKSGQTFILNHRRESWLLIKGLLIATVLHSIFNYLIITTGPASLAIVFVVFAAFILLSDFEKFKKTDI